MAVLVELLALATGLDLDDIEGRATLRVRVADQCRTYSVEDLVATANAFGREVEVIPGAAGRASLLRVLGNSTIVLAMKGKSESVKVLPRTQTASEQRSMGTYWAQLLGTHREQLDLTHIADRSIFFSRIRRSLASMPLGTVCVLALAHQIPVSIGDERVVLVERLCQQALTPALV